MDQSMQQLAQILSGTAGSRPAAARDCRACPQASTITTRLCRNDTKADLGKLSDLAC